jgi:phage/plasmid-associated DNA primase
MFKHKGDAEWTWATVDAFVRSNPGHREWSLLLDRLCVVDADDTETVAWIEGLGLPELADCPVQATRKGRHYFFLRPAWADVEGFWDGARQHPTHAADFKTLCATGSRGVIAVEPSTGKAWLEGRAPWDVACVLRDAPKVLVEMVATAKRPRPPPGPQRAPRAAKRAVAPVAPVAPEASVVAPEATEVSAAASAPVTPPEPPSEDCTYAGLLVGLLSDARADSYRTWMEVGWCLKNVGKEALLPLWLQFSRRSPKFDEGVCLAKWAGMDGTRQTGRNGLGLGSLILWAREDSPAGFKRLTEDSIFADVTMCNGSHNAMARIAFKVLRGKYVCALANGKLWYVYDGSLWREDPEAIRLRHDLSTTLRDHFMVALNRMVAPSYYWAEGGANEGSGGSTSGSVVSVSPSASASRCGGNGRNRDARAAAELLLRITHKLEDVGFKDGVLKEMREYFYDPDFLERLDGDPNLLAFTNGVWDLREGAFRKSRPEDRVSLSVGYDYSVQVDEDAVAMVERYWTTLHPDPAQRAYVQRMFARQLYGDYGQELFHVHAGHQATASNGKTRFFDVMERCLGKYVRKFGVEMLTARQRPEPGKPMPEFAHWRGVRVLYCSEPNNTDAVNSGILKDLTGGEVVMYRLLFANEVKQFRPQFKIHMLCNDTPNLDGGDSGVQRRTRKIDYISRFVDEAEVDEARHMYARDPAIAGRFEGTVAAKLAFLKLLLRNYDHAWEFQMPSVVKASSQEYIRDNDAVRRFAQENLKVDVTQFFTLQHALTLFKTCDYYNHRPKAFKAALERILGVECQLQKWWGKRKLSSVFEGHCIIHPEDEDEDGDL